MRHLRPASRTAMAAPLARRQCKAILAAPAQAPMNGRSPHQARSPPVRHRIDRRNLETPRCRHAQKYPSAPRKDSKSRATPRKSSRLLASAPTAKLVYKFRLCRRRPPVPTPIADRGRANIGNAALQNHAPLEYAPGHLWRARQRPRYWLVQLWLQHQTSAGDPHQPRRNLACSSPHGRRPGPSSRPMLLPSIPVVPFHSFHPSIFQIIFQAIVAGRHCATQAGPHLAIGHPACIDPLGHLQGQAQSPHEPVTRRSEQLRSI